jgi:hypothetical protein
MGNLAVTCQYEDPKIAFGRGVYSYCTGRARRARRGQTDHCGRGKGKIRWAANVIAKRPQDPSVRVIQVQVELSLNGIMAGNGNCAPGT